MEGGGAGGGGKALSPTLDGFVLPFSLQIDNLPANEELFCNFIFVATILIPPTTPHLTPDSSHTLSNKQSGPSEDKEKN